MKETIRPLRSAKSIVLLPSILKEFAEASKAFTYQDTGRIMSRLNGLDLSKLKDAEGGE